MMNGIELLFLEELNDVEQNLLNATHEILFTKALDFQQVDAFNFVVNGGFNRVTVSTSGFVSIVGSDAEDHAAFLAVFQFVLLANVVNDDNGVRHELQAFIENIHPHVRIEQTRTILRIFLKDPTEKVSLLEAMRSRTAINVRHPVFVTGDDFDGLALQTVIIENAKRDVQVTRHAETKTITEAGKAGIVAHRVQIHGQHTGNSGFAYADFTGETNDELRHYFSTVIRLSAPAMIRSLWETMMICSPNFSASA